LVESVGARTVPLTLVVPPPSQVAYTPPSGATAPPHWLGTPPPPHTLGAVQVPQVMIPPQPSPTEPQVAPA
jgi:hypothetical protein